MASEYQIAYLGVNLFRWYLSRSWKVLILLHHHLTLTLMILWTLQSSQSNPCPVLSLPGQMYYLRRAQPIAPRPAPQWHTCPLSAPFQLLLQDLPICASRELSLGRASHPPLPSRRPSWRRSSAQDGARLTCLLDARLNFGRYALLIPNNHIIKNRYECCMCVYDEGLLIIFCCFCVFFFQITLIKH